MSLFCDPERTSVEHVDELRRAAIAIPFGIDCQEGEMYIARHVGRIERLEYGHVVLEPRVHQRHRERWDIAEVAEVLKHREHVERRARVAGFGEDIASQCYGLAVALRQSCGRRKRVERDIHLPSCSQA